MKNGPGQKNQNNMAVITCIEDLRRSHDHELLLLKTTGEYDCDVIIQGPKGKISIKNLVWCPDNRQDLLECYYWESWFVLQGAYHCCFSIPGKVSLLPE